LALFILYNSILWNIFTIFNWYWKRWIISWNLKKNNNKTITLESEIIKNNFTFSINEYEYNFTLDYSDLFIEVEDKCIFLMIFEEIFDLFLGYSFLKKCEIILSKILKLKDFVKTKLIKINLIILHYQILNFKKYFLNLFFIRSF